MKSASAKSPASNPPKKKSQTKAPTKPEAASSTVKAKTKKAKPANSEQPAPKTWVLYVLRCADNTLYCGITNRFEHRLAAHNQGKGARYTKGRAPIVLIKKWPAASMSAALKAERAFKSLTKSEKEKKLRSRSKKDPISVLLLGTP